MGILNANPKLSTIPSLLGALRHEAHLRSGRLVSVDLAHLHPQVKLTQCVDGSRVKNLHMTNMGVI